VQEEARERKKNVVSVVQNEEEESCNHSDDPNFVPDQEEDEDADMSDVITSEEKGAISDEILPQNETNVVQALHATENTVIGLDAAEDSEESDPNSKLADRLQKFRSAPPTETLSVVPADELHY